MKKIKMFLTGLVVGIVMLFSGCSQMDTPYSIAKTTYKVGKFVAPIVPVSDETKASLIVVDEVATSYDNIRTTVRGQEEPKK